MPGAHRDTDTRYCDALTTVTGQTTVSVNGRLWAVEGDPNTHGNGDLIAQVGDTVRIGGKKVIVIGDTAEPDNAGHTPTDVDPSGFSGTVSAYG